MDNTSKSPYRDDKQNGKGTIKKITGILSGIIFESVFETLFEVVAMFLIVNSVSIDNGSDSSSLALKYTKVGEYMLDYDSYAWLFFITNILTFIFLAIVFKRIREFMSPYRNIMSITSKYSVVDAFNISYIAIISVAVMNLIDFIIYQVDYEWVLLDVLTFACLFVTSGVLIVSGSTVLKKGLKPLGVYSISAGIVFLVDALSYIIDFAPSWPLTVSAVILFLEMTVFYSYGQSKIKTKTNQALSESKLLL